MRFKKLQIEERIDIAKRIEEKLKKRGYLVNLIVLNDILKDVHIEQYFIRQEKEEKETEKTN